MAVYYQDVMGEKIIFEGRPVILEDYVSCYEGDFWYIEDEGEHFRIPDDIEHLENIFENKRDSVRIIRSQVREYEKAVLDEAKRLEQARLKEQEAERLRQEAESLKQNK